MITIRLCRFEYDGVLSSLHMAWGAPQDGFSARFYELQVHRIVNGTA